MKKVSIIYSATIFEEVKNDLEELGVKAYSIIPTIFGKGLITQPKFDNHVWPGKNQMIIVLCDDKSAKLILEKADNLREKYPREGIVAYIENIEDITKHDKTNQLK